MNQILGHVLDRIVEEERVTMSVDWELFSIVKADFVDFVSERQTFCVFWDGLEVFAASKERKGKKKKRGKDGEGQRGERKGRGKERERERESRGR